MAVIQISKIQVRRGLQENLPQLGSGELGWSIDTQRLYIGNGTVAEGAPEIGNTEIITAGRDILSAIRSYTFKGRESTYTSQTGSSALNPVSRYFQDKIDEQISLRDFISESDITSGDYTSAIQRAINQIYPRSYYTTVGVRRRLHIPAGVWPITANIIIPPYASIFGDGPRSTIIKQVVTSGSTDPVIQFSDSRGNIGVDVDTTTSDAPFQIDISNLTLQTELDNDIAIIESSQIITFSGVRFQGNLTAPTTIGTSKSAVTLLDTVSPTHNILFDRCEFARITHGIVATGNISAVTINNSLFDTLYQGIKTNANVGSPQGIKITESKFDNIANSAVYSLDDSSVVSAFNYFANVGYNNTPILDWNTSNNYSISDIFERSLVAQASTPITTVGINQAATLTQSTTSGAVQDKPAVTLSLTNNTTASTTLVLTTVTPAAIIDYRLSRGVHTRTGTIHVSHYNGTVIFDDEYSESSSLGVTLNFIGNATANTATLSYTTTNTGSAAYLKYAIRSFV